MLLLAPVAGELRKCRVVDDGGNGAIDRLAFPETCGFTRSTDDIAKIALHLLTDGTHYQESVARMESVASRSLTFKVVARQLGDFVGRLSSPTAL